MSEESTPEVTPVGVVDPVTGTVITPIPQLTETGLDLLDKVLDQIEDDESAWNQSTWIGLSGGHSELSDEVIAYITENQAPPWDCGTAMCVAGHVALAKGAKLTGQQLSLVAEGRGLEASFVVTPDGREVDVPIYAREVLGLTEWQASRLFEGSNALVQLRRIAADIRKTQENEAKAEAEYQARLAAREAQIAQIELAEEWAKEFGGARTWASDLDEKLKGIRAEKRRIGDELYAKQYEIDDLRSKRARLIETEDSLVAAKFALESL